MKRMVVTLIGLVNSQNDVLISKRKNSSLFSGFWEFPGGKVEKKESLTEALLRETKEELGLILKSSCVAPLTFSVYPTEKQEILLLLFICRKWNGQPTAMEGQELRWVKPLDLSQYKMPPANIFLNSILRDWVGS